MMKPLFSALPSRKDQQGFTLIELMIALVIGLAVVLGAGKLFLLGLQGFREVEALGNKQEAINFAANTLVRDIRRAGVDKYGNSLVESFEESDERLRNDRLEIRFVNSGDITDCNGPDDLVYRVYRLSSSLTNNEGYSLNMGEGCEAGLYSLSYQDLNYQPLVAGFAGNGFEIDKIDPSSGGVWRLELTLSPGEAGSADNIQIYSVNRTWAVINADTISEADPAGGESNPSNGNNGKGNSGS